MSGGRRHLVFTAATAVALGAVVILVLWAWPRQHTAPRSQPPDVPDNLLVYCLRPGRQQALLDAAVVLGVASGGTPSALVLADGTTTTLSSWRLGHRGDFARTCAALALADGGPSPAAARPAAASSAQPLFVVLPAVLAAVLSSAFVEWRAARERRRATADRLRATSIELRRRVLELARGHVEGVTARPPAGDLQRARDDLAAQVSRMVRNRRRRPLAGVIHAALTDPAQETYFARPWPPDASVRQTMRDCAAAWASSLEDATERLACAVESPLLSRHWARGSPVPPRLDVAVGQRDGTPS